jgi:hypothetical protein
MEYAKPHEIRRHLPVFLRARVALRRAFRGRNQHAVSLDPRSLSEHALRDIGLSSPNTAWEDSVGFWRRGY